MAETEMKMAIDPFMVIQKALISVKKPRITRRIVSIDYDEPADILYVKFKHTKVVDNKSLDEEGLVTASLDKQGEAAGLMIMEASKFAATS
ncbi:MAG: DUF2283 domain-containing protein [Candidatus Bathyarchaeia archaeon]|nr:DUF2283 domain-containing protein [Candidatus Bathyarchaeia archaeon]